jgi:hypothetical protein
MNHVRRPRRGKSERTAPRQKTSPTSSRKRAAQRRDALVPSLIPAANPALAPDSALGRLIALFEPPPLPEVASPAIAGAEPQASPAISQALHKEMLWRIATLEIGMSALSRPTATGDDDSAEPAQQELNDADRQTVETAIAFLKRLPPQPDGPLVEALEAAQLLRAIGTRSRNAASVSTWPSKQAGLPVEAAKPTDRQFGKRGMQSPFWLADRIDALSDAAINWINSLYLAN